MRRFVPASREPQMFAEMNTTPLIDVMLVLLVMVIITIPIMNHEVPVDLPGPAPGPIELRVTHRLEIAAGGGFRWTAWRSPMRRCPHGWPRFTPIPMPN